MQRSVGVAAEQSQDLERGGPRCESCAFETGLLVVALEGDPDRVGRAARPRRHAGAHQDAETIEPLDRLLLCELHLPQAQQLERELGCAQASVA